jgi:hypothetical protein
MTGERAAQLWTEAMTAIKSGDFAKAEEIAKSMHLESDAGLVRKRIEEARASLVTPSD